MKDLAGVLKTAWTGVAPKRVLADFNQTSESTSGLLMSRAQRDPPVVNQKKRDAK